MYYSLDKETGETKQITHDEWEELVKRTDHWFEYKKVLRSEFEFCGVEYTVSTVFLAVDHSTDFNGGEPILFETMVFTEDKEFSDLQIRYTGYKDSVEGHYGVVLSIIEKIEENVNAGLYNKAP